MRNNDCMTKTFRDAFLEALGATGLSLAEVARRSGVSKEQLSKLKQRENARTNVDDARRVAGVFGQSLDEFLSDEAAKTRAEIVLLLEGLTEEERRFLLAAARGVVSLHNQED